MYNQICFPKNNKLAMKTESSWLSRPNNIVSDCQKGLESFLFVSCNSTIAVVKCANLKRHYKLMQKYVDKKFPFGSAPRKDMAPYVSFVLQK